MAGEMPMEPERTEEEEEQFKPRTQGVGPLVVVAEDDDQLREVLSYALQREGMRVIEIRDGQMLISYLATCEARREFPDLVITDHRMPGLSGIEVLAGLNQSGWRTPLILITAFADEELHDLANQLGATAVLEKPIDLEKLRSATKWALERTT